MKQIKPQRWKLFKLKAHPQQTVMFDDLPEVELLALADDIQKNGLRHPVEILPCGTIIAGHQRVRAARYLEWTEIDVIIRRDLASKGAGAVEAHLIRDNFTRRQLSPLARARCIHRLVEVEATGSLRCNGSARREQIKAEIGRRLQMSARNVTRYLLVLSAPLEVQRAFDLGELTLVSAGRVTLLPKDKQKDLVERIENDEPIAQVVKELLASSNGNCNAPDRSFSRLILSLRRELANLEHRIGDIDSQRVSRSAGTLRSARDLLQALLARSKRQRV